MHSMVIKSNNVLILLLLLLFITVVNLNPATSNNIDAALFGKITSNIALLLTEMERYLGL